MIFRRNGFLCFYMFDNCKAFMFAVYSCLYLIWFYLGSFNPGAPFTLSMLFWGLDLISCNSLVILLSLYCTVVLSALLVNNHLPIDVDPRLLILNSIQHGSCTTNELLRCLRKHMTSNIVVLIPVPSLLVLVQRHQVCKYTGAH